MPYSRLPRPALAARFAIMAALLGFLFASFQAPHAVSQQPEPAPAAGAAEAAEFDPLAALEAQAEAQPAASNSDPGGHMVRTDAQLTSATLAMSTIALGADGVLGFNLLRTTKLGTKPPPVYIEQLEKWDGKIVKMRGFMAPFDSLSDMRNFMLFSTPTGCAFCTPPSPREVVIVEIISDKEVPWIADPIEIEGTLRLWREDSKDPMHTMFLYAIKDAKVRKLGEK